MTDNGSKAHDGSKANGSRRRPPARLELANEFAHVTIDVVETGNGARLRLHDNGTKRAIDLDPVVLAALVWLDDRDLDRIVDPQFAIEANARGQRAGTDKVRKSDLGGSRS